MANEITTQFSIVTPELELGVSQSPNHEIEFETPSESLVTHNDRVNDQFVDSNLDTSARSATTAFILNSGKDRAPGIIFDTCVPLIVS
jgi:hypothetical protein